MVFKYLILLTGCTLSLPVVAQDVEPDLHQAWTRILSAEPGPDDMHSIVVTGERTPVHLLNRPLTVIGLEEIRSIQGVDITRILQRAPGVTFSRNGGAGGLTSVRLRGSEADQLLVLLDGVPLNDASSPGGGYDFATLLPAGVSKVEVLRSANSTIWGSRAMGGVIAMSSQEQSGMEALAEYGGPQTYSMQAAAGHYSAPFEAYANAAFLGSSGISAAAEGEERDGLRQWQAGGSALARPFDMLEARLTYRHADGRTEIDGFPAPDFTLADTEEWQRSRFDSGRAELTYWNRKLNLRGAYSLSQTRRANFDPTFGPDANFTSSGRTERLELRGEWKALERTFLQFGTEQEWSRYASAFALPQKTRIGGTYLQLGHRADRFRVNAGLRRDDHRDFGGQLSLGADAAIDLFDDWEVQASYGEGFKAPTLFQLHSDFGNSQLHPEHSRSWDLAVKKGVRNSRSFISLGVFRRDSLDLIGFISCFGESGGICVDRPFGTYDNIGRARAQGVELETQVQLTYRLRAQAALAYIDTRDRSPLSPIFGNRLARRPTYAGTFTLDWEALEDRNIFLGADLRVSSSSFDNAANTERLGSYALLDLRVRAPLSEEYELFGRVENIWNERYQTAAGYSSPGRAAYVGARVRF